MSLHKTLMLYGAKSIGAGAAPAEAIVAPPLPNHQPGEFFGGPVGWQVRSYFLYLPLKEIRNLSKVVLWRRRRQLISDPSGCLRSGTIGDLGAPIEQLLSDGEDSEMEISIQSLGE